MLLLPKNMTRLRQFGARLTCLLLCFPDPRLLMSDLRTVWPDVFRDTTMIAGRLTSFAEMLLEGLCKFKIAFSQTIKSLPLLDICLLWGGIYLSEEVFSLTPCLESSCFF
jgi:hypothetical protein